MNYATQGQPLPPWTPPPAHRPVSTNGLATASLVTSLVGIQALGIIFGHIALSQIKRTGQAGRGLALAGVIIGWATVAFIVIVAAVLVPTYLGRANTAHEETVKSDLQTAWIAVTAYGVDNPETDEPPSFTDGSLADYGFTQSIYTETIEATGTYSTGITLTATSVDGHTFEISDDTGIIDLG